MRIIWILFGLAIVGSNSMYAQLRVTGKIIDAKLKEPLPGAVVGWVGTASFAYADAKGNYKIDRPDGAFLLYASFIGYAADTIRVALGRSEADFQLVGKAESLTEVTVRDTESATGIKKRDVTFTELITEREILKAACCNLSESFETNPAIDASFTDAITGTRQIRLLGLDGPYSLYTRGNIPTLGGLASVLGLQLIPGSWIQSIQLTKGSGSVINGFESVAGQVNYELRQSDAKEKAYVQLYANQGGRFEQSAVIGHKLNEKVSTAFMLYGRQQYFEPDFNHDGFLDIPQGPMYIFQNTWKIQGTKGWESHSGVKYAHARLTGGQIAHHDLPIWQSQMNTDRLEVWNKTGYVFKKPGRSMGLQLSYNYHDQTADFGLKGEPTYAGIENTFFSNLIFQDIIGDTRHQYKTGVSYKWQRISENYLAENYLRDEHIPGVYGEYSYLPNDNFSAVTGLRVDYHNYYGSFVTPRVHVRYEPWKNHAFRGNIGGAARTPNLFADHIGLMASAREWQIFSSDNNLPYNGLEQERSYNMGVSYVYSFELDYRPGAIRAEYFYTTFQNQLVKDWDATARAIQFYNLDGRSFAHSAQFQMDYEVIQRLEMRLAYRFIDARTTYQSIGLAKQPFIAPHRFFVNAAYETRSHWKLDVTYSILSAQRLPTTLENSLENRRDEFSPTFGVMNLQLSKTFREVLEAHIGVENALDYMMPNPIVSAENPFSQEFDAAMIWGPIMGRMVYAGIRWRFLR